MDGRMLSPIRSTIHQTWLPWVFAGLCLALSSCSPSIAPFSLSAYEMAVDLKVDALRLMDNAEQPYADSSKKIADLKVSMDKAFEFAAGRPKNVHSTEQWNMMNDPDRNLMAGFLLRWEEETSLSRTFIVEAKKIISRSFDAIIGLESGKIGGDELE